MAEIFRNSVYDETLSIYITESTARQAIALIDRRLSPEDAITVKKLLGLEGP